MHVANAFTAADARAEQTLVSTNDTLIINGWRMVYPTFLVNKKTGETTVYWHMQEKGDESRVLKPGEKAGVRWINTRYPSWNKTPAGFSVEDTKTLFNWWKNGGRGEFRVDKGKWVRVASKPVQNPVVKPAPNPQPSGNNGSNAGSGSGSGSNTPGSGTTSSAPNNKVQEANKRMRAAYDVYKQTPTTENFKIYQDLYNEYTRLAANQGK